MAQLKQYIKQTITAEKMNSLIFAEVVLGVALSLFLLFFFLYISDAVIDQEIRFFDTTISNFAYSIRTPWLTNIMQFLSFMGEQMLIIEAIAVVIFLTLKKHRKEAFIFTILLLMGIFVTFFLKTSFKVPRPSDLALITLNSYSFPSGHALNSFLFYGALAYFTFHFKRDKVISFLVIAIAILLTLLIGFSRIYLGVHRPSDVLAGYITGFWLLVTIILVDKTIIYFKFMKEPRN